MNKFIYRKAKQECVGKSDNWVRQAVNEVLSELTKRIEELKTAPPSEEIDRVEAVLAALKDELKSRGLE